MLTNDILSLPPITKKKRTSRSKKKVVAEIEHSPPKTQRVTKMIKSPSSLSIDKPIKLSSPYR